MAFAFIQTELDARAAEQLRRQHVVIEEDAHGMIKVDGAAYINFSSNDYLGLRQHPRVLQRWAEGLAQYGGGSGASPLVTGYTRAHQQLCDNLADLLNREAVLLFSSGFAANHAICQALLKPDSIVYADKLSHASLIEGARNSQGTLKRFHHNDLSHLHRLLNADKKALEKDRLIATEGVFSMDGDQAPVTALVDTVRSHTTTSSAPWLMIDDAHGFGVVGEHGAGVAASATQNECQIIMATLGKACGTGGAFVAGSPALIDYLTQFAKHYIYSTAMPPAQALASSMALKLIQRGEQREVLHTNIAHFTRGMQASGFAISGSDSAIQPVIIGEAHKTLAYAERLKALGIWVTPIRYPTVPKGTARLRITLSAQHQSQDIDALVDALCIVRDAMRSSDDTRVE
ncbi:aminotransferase class I/II-fold pyridoxal phosphate-dependent enzyme [Alteromonas oceanisediminis]|uniref:aminotransferase class I/II-fold pyridoxal phosphate-dependent enzyme n=1 Tax=Alteromonas oceanisediminis TaxID=2836180 RepID=UPI001BD9D061|nr:8-amino-7-oxononanoate synthase [Alteromonas oceanisediminis]MBT0587629.1 8-amino-7-oxononanoate synthase [Alteromonas oceanisediminis]